MVPGDQGFGTPALDKVTFRRIYNFPSLLISQFDHSLQIVNELVVD